MGRSHSAMGTISGAGAAWFTHLPPLQSAGIVAVTTVCALLPDFDHDDASLPRAFGIPGRFLAWCIEEVFGHRTITHSFLGVFALAGALRAVPRVGHLPQLPGWVFWGILLGCATHILGDLCTESGVPLLWPLEPRFRIGWLDTGGWVETQIVTPVLYGLAALAVGGLILGGLLT